MKVVQINATCGTGSTGKICVAISERLNKHNIENYICYSSGTSQYQYGIKYMTDHEIRLGALEARIRGNYGFNSSKATKRLVDILKKYDADMIHLHNIHGHNCNLSILFDYLKANHKKIIWTFHDCWAFTGHCCYFTYPACRGWLKDCTGCIRPHEFSWFIDSSSKLLCKKRELLKGLDLTIVTPSIWLADLVRQSFLKDYPIYTINNGIDLSVFAPTESAFRQKHGLEEKCIVLGVAFGWGKRKGLDVFLELAKRLDERYQIVLVGTDSVIDKQLPNHIISIHRTQDQHELAEIYSAADVFVNPTREDNFPTVNMEAIACGTPVITFKTGGSPECIDKTCGIVVPCDDIDAMEKAVRYVCADKPFSQEACLARARCFDQREKFQEYVKLYEEYENCTDI